MTITGRAGRASGIPMDPLRRTACLAGVLYLATFASSIPARFFFLDPVLSDPQYILGSGDGTRVVIGGVLDMVNALACIGTAVVLFTVVKRQNETLALGFVTPLLGLIGGPLLLTSVTGIVFSTHALDSGLHVIAAAPIFLWELSLGVWLVIKGFRPSPITAAVTSSVEASADLSRA